MRQVVFARVSLGIRIVDAMARKLREDPLGGVHHVMNRSARRYDCFLDDRDRTIFIQLVAEACEEFQSVVLAYCLMGNHFHLLVECPEAGISGVMKRVLQNYTQIFNKIHGYDGPLFRDRFNSKLVDSDAYLIAASRYIHRNPLEMGVKIHPYRWSSFGAYVGTASRPPWLNPDRILDLGSGRDGYRRLVEADVASDAISITAGVRPMLPEPPAPTGTPSFSSIDSTVFLLTGTDIAELARPVRGAANAHRAMAAFLATEARVYPASDVAAHYRFGSRGSLRSALSRFRRDLEENPALRTLLQNARLQLQQGV